MAVKKQENKVMIINERRYLPRWDVQNLVVYKLDEDPKEHTAFTKDMSCMGTCLLTYNTQEDIKERSLKLRIYFNKEKSIQVEGRIKWIREASGKHLLGITFENISQEDQDYILHNAFGFNEKKLANYWFRDWNTN